MNGSHVAARQEPLERFTPEEQAMAVWFSHLGLLGVVVIVMSIGFSQGAPDQFFIAEGAILLILGTFVVDFTKMTKFFSRWFPRIGGALTRGVKEWTQWGPRYAFAAAFVLQYVALTPLLDLTGGPIDSPFAQVMVAFAVFTPLLATSRWTIGISLIWSVAYYATFVALHGFDDKDAVRPSPWVFFAVTVLILFVTVGVTVLDRKDANRQYLEYLGGGGSANGGSAATGVDGANRTDDQQQSDPTT